MKPKVALLAKWSALALCVILILLCFPGDGLQFVNSKLEFVRVQCFFLLPVLITLIACNFAPESQRLHKYQTFLLPISFCSLALAVLAAFQCDDLLFTNLERRKHLKSVLVGKNRLEVYRTNPSGALGPYEVELTLEQNLVPHAINVYNTSITMPELRRVKHVDTIYGQSDLDVLVRGEHTFAYVRQGSHGHSTLVERSIFDGELF